MAMKNIFAKRMPTGKNACHIEFKIIVFAPVKQASLPVYPTLRNRQGCLFYRFQNSFLENYSIFKKD
jgi:hypothetical protein